MILRAARLGLLVAAGLGTATPALGQNPVDELGLSTSLRLGAWLSDRSLTEGEGFLPAMAWLRVQPPEVDGAILRLEGWVAARDLTDGDVDEGNGVDAELREAYLGYFGERHELRVGRQIVVWGRADRLNPTDTIGSRDFRLLVPEDDDQRRGSLMLRERLTLGETTTLDLFWLPEFRPNRFAVRTPAGVSLRNETERWEPVQFAAKLDGTGADFDWSLSYFDGLDRNPDFGLEPATLRLVHNRIRVLGADAAATVGRYGLRAEVAYVHTEDEDGDDPAVKNPFLSGVIGGDRSFFQYLNVNLQYFARMTRHHQDPRDIADPALRAAAVAGAAASGQLDPVQHGMSMRIAYQWLNETLDTELAAVAAFSDGSIALRPKIVYRWADALRLTIGADIFRGGDTDAFGRLRDNSTVFAELRYGF